MIAKLQGTKNVSAVLVLSHLMDKDGNLMGESAARASKAFDLFTKFKCNFLITSGWDYRNDTNIPIADAVKKHLILNCKARKENIIVERTPRDTVGDAIFVKYNVVLPNSISSLYVVTSEYHVNRVTEIFNFFYREILYFEVIAVETKHDTDIDILDKEKHSVEAFRNTFNNVDAKNKTEVMNALFLKHPYYNGSINPKI